jgi:hypothetical protein
MVMKKLVLLFLLSFTGMASVNAQATLNPNFNWVQVLCKIVDKDYRSKGRSVMYVPQLYKSEEYLSVQSDVANYGNVQITVANSQGETVKNDIMQVTAGGENLYYIGDLDSGEYEVTVEFDDFTLVGEICF